MKIKNLKIGMDSGSDGQIGYYVLGPEELRAEFMNDIGISWEGDFDNVITHLWDNGAVGKTAFVKGWWVNSCKKRNQKHTYEASKDLPAVVIEFIRASYALGINPLPQLREGLPRIKWEYVSSSHFISNSVKSGSVTNTYFIQHVDQPVVLVAWCDQTDELAIAVWNGRCWYGDFESPMFPYRLHGPKMVQ